MEKFAYELTAAELTARAGEILSNMTAAEIDDLRSILGEKEFHSVLKVKEFFNRVDNYNAQGKYAEAYLEKFFFDMYPWQWDLRDSYRAQLENLGGDIEKFWAGVGRAQETMIQ